MPFAAAVIHPPQSKQEAANQECDDGTPYPLQWHAVLVLRLAVSKAADFVADACGFRLTCFKPCLQVCRLLPERVYCRGRRSKRLS